jgi:hypothetical protein
MMVKNDDEIKRDIITIGINKLSWNADEIRKMLSHIIVV